MENSETYKRAEWRVISKVYVSFVFMATSVKSINLHKYLQCINHSCSCIKTKGISRLQHQSPWHSSSNKSDTTRAEVQLGWNDSNLDFQRTWPLSRRLQRRKFYFAVAVARTMHTRAYRSCTATLLCPFLCLCRSLFSRRGPVRADERESLSRSNERLTARWCIGSDLHWRRPRGNQPASLPVLRLDTSPPQGPAKTSREGRELTALPLPAA